MNLAVPNKPDFVRTLIGSGFVLSRSNTATNYFKTVAERTDQLGVRSRYVVAVASCRLNNADVSTLVRVASREQAGLVIVGEVVQARSGVSVLTFEQFVDRLGGPILSMLPLDPQFGDGLKTLGTNKLPSGLQGAADDLFEQYVHAGLQFIFRTRVVRYGQDRRGEEVPDGIALSVGAPLILYDAKAARGGYEMTTTSERQFADYVNSFHQAYERPYGRLTAFLVISGSFRGTDESLERRSRKVFADCGVPLTFMDAQTLSDIVAMFVHEPLFRQAIDWPLVFARPIVRASDVREQLDARRRDRIVEGQA